MKALFSFIAGIILGALVVFALTHRYEILVTDKTSVPMIIKVDRWTGKSSTEFAIPDAAAKK